MLTCDCYAGCWDDHSKDWPSLVIPDELIELERKRGVHYPTVAARTKLVNAAKIPYGAFFSEGSVLRVETTEMLDRLREAVRVATTKPAPLTFIAATDALVARDRRWLKGRTWYADRYLLAAVGEIGEIANAIKKLWRIEDGIDNRSADPERQLNSREEVLAYVRKEFGDAFSYLILAAAKYEIDPGEALREVFNAKSEQHGFPERL